MNNSRIVLLVVTYNRLEKLKKCLSSIDNQTYSKFDVIVIDNSSTDGTENFLKSEEIHNNKLRVYRTEKNLGGAGGFNFGIKKSVELNYDYIWIMDDDTYPEPSALEKFVDAIKLVNDDFGFFAGYVKWTDGSPCVMNKSRISQKTYDDIQLAMENKMLRVDSSSFVSCFVKSVVVLDLGLPIKEFFIWGDDTEFTQRISSKYPCWLVYDSQVIHDMKENQGVESLTNPKIERVDRYYYQYRNQIFIHKKASKASYYKCLYDSYKDICVLHHSNIQDKKHRISIIRKGIRDGKKFNPSIEYINKSL